MATDQQDQDPVSAGKPSRFRRWLSIASGARAAIGWMRANRLVTALSTVALLIGVAIPTAATWRSMSAHDETPDATLDETLRFLDDGMLGHARDLAKQRLASPQLADRDVGGPAFVLGAVATTEAELLSDSPYRTRLFQLAAEYLSVASEKSFPAGRETEGLYLLGKSLFHSQQFSQAIPVLEKGLVANSPYTKEIVLLVARAYTLETDPDLGKASTYIAQYLASADLTRQQIDDGRILRAKVLFAQGRDESCLQILNDIREAGRNHTEAPVLKGRILLRQADQLRADGSNDSPERADELYRTAIETLRQVQAREANSGETTRESGYLIGVAYRGLRDYRAAYEQFERISVAYYDTEEGIASGLEKAETLRQLDRDDEALNAYRETLRVVGAEREYRNRWMSIDEFQKRCLAAYDDFLEQRKFNSATQLARMLSPAFPRARAILLEARAQKAWADDTTSQAAQLDPVPAAAVRKEAEKIQRALGRTYQRLARIRISTRSYPDDVLHSAEAYLAGRDHGNAVRQYQAYFKTEPTQRRAAAHVGLGRALLALGYREKAIAEFQECFEYHQRDPAAYQARLLCAKSWVEENDTIKARELLMDNLYRFELTPESPDWRDSLFELGQIYFQEGSLGIAETNLQPAETADRTEIRARLESLEARHAALEQSERRLDQAIRKYPKAPQAVRARYLLANAYRLSSKLPAEKMKNVTIETTRITLKRQMESELERSLEVFRSLIEDLSQQQGQRELTDLEIAIQRNSYFSRGDLLYQLHQYEKAIEAYSIASHRYQRRPEALEAFVQIANCYRQLDKKIEARGTVEQAKVILARIDPSVIFRNTTRFSRDEWATYLDWLATL